jgi:FKBP-type peptidyl-prolyl cis-trans isomerase FklB
MMRPPNMKRELLSIMALGVLAGAVATAAPQTDPKNDAKPGEAKPAEPPKPDYSKIFKDNNEKQSYALGMSYGSGLRMNFKNQAPDFEFNVDALVKGFKEGMDGSATLITDAQMKEILGEFRQEIQARVQAKRQEQAAANKKEADAFFAENKDKPGVITLTNGLQYKVLTEGTGDMPKEFDTVSVNYRGTLLNGTEFDSSYKRGQPATFPVKGVIKGWTQALQMMKKGAKWQLFIPADLAYGDRGSGPNIGPGAALTFEIELLDIKAGTAPANNPATPLTSDIIKVPSKEEMEKGAKIETIKAEDAAKEAAKAQTNK